MAAKGGKKETMTAEQAREAVKQAFADGETACPLCKGKKTGKGFVHADGCLGKVARAGNKGARKQALVGSLSDDQKQRAEKLALEYKGQADVLKYAAMLCQKAPSRVAVASLWDMLKEAGADERLIGKMRTAVAAS